MIEARRVLIINTCSDACGRLLALPSLPPIPPNLPFQDNLAYPAKREVLSTKLECSKLRVSSKKLLDANRTFNLLHLLF